MRVLYFLAVFLVFNFGAAFAQDPAPTEGETAATTATAEGQKGSKDKKVVMLSNEWGKAACVAWNDDSVLTKGLKESGWIEGDKDDRGFRIIEIYRSDCPDSSHVQLKFVDKEEKALCVDSGPMFDKEWDFLMYAKTEHWIAMGKGDVGPMGGMMTGKLSFKGSMWEAMQNMGPFKNFLLLFGKIPSTTDTCN
ncbi:MAG: SCP2 sterol-binding domain-containing protein [Nitrospinota bacterium]|nr:SCP2 sterol-binding domain-containing protein [Nitrospinota bacterium]